MVNVASLRGQEHHFVAAYAGSRVGHLEMAVVRHPLLDGKQFPRSSRYSAVFPVLCFLIFFFAYFSAVSETFWIAPHIARQ